MQCIWYRPDLNTHNLFHGRRMYLGNLYYQVIEVTDFGPYVTKLVLAMPREAKNMAIGRGRLKSR